jgi:hypothetical protein
MEENIIKKEVSLFLQKRGLVCTEKGYTWNNPLLEIRTQGVDQLLKETMLFFKLRGYKWIPEKLNNFLIQGKPRIAGIQYFRDLQKKGKYLDLFYSVRFNDIRESKKTHSVGFFMLGIHKFNIREIEGFLSCLQDIMDFLRNKGINSLAWDFWTDGKLSGLSLEFFDYEEIEIANFVFTLYEEGKLLKEPLVDFGMGWERYLKLITRDNLRDKLSKEEKVSLLLMICKSKGLVAGRRGIRDNIKRIEKEIDWALYDINNFKKVKKYWNNNKATGLTFSQEDFLWLKRDRFPSNKT